MQEEYNFLDPRLNPELQSYSGVSNDDYLPENLISKNVQKINLGFMSYSVTKPPVDLIFKLMCPVNISSIKIWTTIGSLKTTGLEISTIFRNKTFKISECYFKDEKTTQGFYFHNVDRTFNMEYPANFEKSKFFISQKLSYSKAEIVKITIKKTLNCAPVIKRIEIWGKPHYNFKRITYSLWNPNLSNIEKFEKIEEKDKITENQSKQEIQIPEEFLDSITYEIMVIPMILPSGKMVDQSTINRMNGMDPFTGLLFKNDRKPILNPSIKLQIDSFLFKNCNNNEIKKVPRTIGKRVRESNVLEENKRLKSGSSGIYTQRNLSENKNECFKCKDDTNLYRIEFCSHLVCKNCIQIETNLCSCGQTFNTKNVIKFHS